MKPTIQNRNFSHDAIALWLIANPDRMLKDCAVHFGYTQAWISAIIHSDAFKARYDDLLGDADTIVINDIPAKLRGVASRALDGLAEAVEVAVADSNSTMMHRGFLLETSDKLLRDLGYGPQKPPVHTTVVENQQNVFVGVDSTTLERARNKLLSQKTNTLPSFITDVVSQPTST